MQAESRIFTKQNIAPLICALVPVVVILFYLAAGDAVRVEVHDDLDLFPAQYMILKHTGTFFSHSVDVPFLGGISRDYLPSELSLVSLLYMIFPGKAAHVAMYVCKVVIAVLSFYLLARETVLYGSGVTATDRRTKRTVAANARTRAEMLADLQGRVLFCGLAYGMLNLFPHFGIAFASIPLALFFLLRIHRCGTWREAGAWYAMLFLYPFVSYFSYFGFFILAYLAVLVIVLWVRAVLHKRRQKKARGDDWDADDENEHRVLSRAPLKLTAALFVLGAGYVVFEYRLFRMMLFSGVPTIRETMSQADISFIGALRQSLDLFVNGNMHTTSVQKYIVMPVCVFYIALITIRYSVIHVLARPLSSDAAQTKDEAAAMREERTEKEPVQPLHAALFVCFGLLVFNCLFGGLAGWMPFRHAIETVLPVLKGFQFNRTYFFNPFLWYLCLCLVTCCIGKKAGTVLALLACAVALLAPVPYNSLFYTAYEQYYRLNHDGNPTDNLTYEDFYATELFDRIREDMGYDTRDYCVSYGMYPAVLQYNGFSTIDGYLGYYPLAYKELFRAVIAPALAKNETARDYFDRFGARCYLYPGGDETVEMRYRSLHGLTDTNLYADPDALKALGCRYLFSRVKLANADALGLALSYAYEDAEPFAVYVYTVQ